MSERGVFVCIIMEYQPHPIANIFPLMSGEEFRTFREDIKENGLREPIWLFDGQIIDGRNRYNACLAVDVVPTFVEYEGDESELLRFVISLNLRRRHLNESQRAMVAASIANMRQGDNQHTASANLHTLQNAADLLNVSRRSVANAQKVKESATPEITALVESGGIAVSAASAIAEESPAFQHKVIESLSSGAKSAVDAIRLTRKTEAQEQAIMPTGKYRVIYADPPWKYNDQMTASYGGTQYHYPTMSISELCELPVTEMADDNAVLFLWVTSPMLEVSFEIIKSWGFKYKTSFVWDKIKHNMGHYNSVRHELLLICTRGSCTPDVSQLFDSVQSIERTKHSAKPHEFREIIETLYTYGDKLELFGREDAEGWEIYGNQLK